MVLGVSCRKSLGVLGNSLMEQPRIIILGGGPAGVGAAFRLAKQGFNNVTVLEGNACVGGNAGSFELAGMQLDYGSHRLHPSCHSEILGDIQSLLGQDLLSRPRHGRIRLNGRWIHFPLKPLDLLLRVSPSFALGVGKDLVQRGLFINRQSQKRETFASVLEAGLGKTICKDFYFPYARKLWGLEPEELSVIQAKRRVGSSSLGKMFGKILSAVPGFKPPGAGRFFYPRLGYGQITASMAQAAQAQGVNFQFGAMVKTLERVEHTIKRVHYLQADTLKGLECDLVWSTLPVTGIIRGMNPSTPSDLLNSIDQLEYRAMLLIYLVLEQDQFTEFDAHYFPEEHIKVSRLSEPKNYSLFGPSGTTVICAELPCSVVDRVWEMTPDELGEVVKADLTQASIPIRVPVKEVVVKRLRHAYPVYREGYEVHFQKLDDYVSKFDNLLSFGRQGLYAHDNTHHAMYMAYSAVKCLEKDGRFDQVSWKRFRKEFETHVVED